MRLLPILLFVCFVLYEVLQVEGKSKQNVAKKLLQKYIHHHKHPHHHKHHHHHVHHHHKRHHHHHHHHHPHHKHWHLHHHQHHHKSFHQKLVEKLKKEKQHHHQRNDVIQKATKRESLPQLLVSLGKGFMQLGKHLGNNESHADVQAKETAIKHAPTPKPLVDDHVATTQAASAIATPSPTSEHYSENDSSDDIGGGALTSASPTPTVSQKFTSFNSESSQSNYRGSTVPRPGNIDSSIITPTPQSKPSPSPGPKPQVTSVSPSKSNYRQMKPTMDPTASRMSKPNQDPSVKPKMPSDSDKENESVTSKDRLDKAKGIDEHRDNSHEPKIPKVKQEESIPNPSIGIPADQARLLEHSPTESTIDGKEEDESSQNEQFATLPTSNENPSPNLFVSKSNIDENSGPLAINATQNDDKVVEPGREDDLSSNDETEGSATVNTAESLNKDVSQGSIDKLDGDQTKSQDKAQVVETKSEDSQSEENVDGNLSTTASDSNLNTESKTEANSTASDEIMDGEVPPSEIVNDDNSMDDLTSKATAFSPTAALKSKIQSTDDGDAKSLSQDSDSDTDSKQAFEPSKIQDSESTADGTLQPSSQDSDNKVANQVSQESSGNSDEATSLPDDDAAAKSHSKQSDSTTDRNTQPKTHIGSTREELAGQPSQESDSTTDQLSPKEKTRSDSTREELARELNQESDNTNDQLSPKEKTRSDSTREELAKEPFQESDSTTDQLNPKGKTRSDSTREELAGKPSQESDSTTDQLNPKGNTRSDSTREELAGEPSQESDSTSDQLSPKGKTRSDSTREELAGEPSQESDRTTDQLNPKGKTRSDSTREELAKEPFQESDSTTDQLNPKGKTRSDSTREELAGKPSQESDSTTDQLNSKGKTRSDSTREELAKEPNQQFDNTTDGEAQTPTSQSVISLDSSAQPSNHGDDDITAGVSESSGHDTEALKDAPISTLGRNNTAGVTGLATPSSETYDDSKSSDLGDGKTGRGVEISQVRSSQDNELYQDAAPESSPISNSTLEVSDSGYSTSDYVTTPEPNHQFKSDVRNLSQSSDQSDDVVDGALRQAPVYQTNTTLDGQEYDDTKGNAAQLSDVPVDLAYNPTGEHFTMEKDQNRVTYGAIKNSEEHQETVIDNSFPREIKDGEVLPPTGNTVLPKTEGFNTPNSNVPAIYN